MLSPESIAKIEYELTNRPAWAHIPLQATLRILEQREAITPWQS